MKTLRILFLMSCYVLVASCDEEAWLEERPFSFYSPENSFVKQEHFEAALPPLYSGMFGIVFPGNIRLTAMWDGTDQAYSSGGAGSGFNNYVANLVPQTQDIEVYWRSFYQVIFNANVIIGRIDDPDVIFNPATRRNEIKAEALFFRAYAYRFLGSLWGGVPLVLEEVQGPRRNFVRNSVDEVWDQCIEDLTFAVAHLPEWDASMEDGRVSKAAANHLLAEIYINKEEWDNSIAASTAVIDDPNYQLMENRFGTKSDEIADPTLNVYWDLFRRENQNRSSGNMEAIFVGQYEFNVTGGGERYRLTRYAMPALRKMQDDNNVNMFFRFGSERYGGFQSGAIISSEYVQNTIWDDPNDIRGKEPNLLRDVQVVNPQSDYYGQWLIADGLYDAFVKDSDPYRSRWGGSLFAKSGPLRDMPIEFLDDPATGETNRQAQELLRDTYYMRLAETYLLRAEAYLGKGDLASAAEDINVVRRRSNAADIAASAVDIDFILDERSRELAWEEKRRVTLGRLGKVVERCQQYNPYYNGDYASNEIRSFHGLWPIPFSEIEVNTDAVLAQNSGYGK